MAKRYLKTPEEVIDALQVGKKVETEGLEYKFINGILTAINKTDKSWIVNPGIYFSEVVYIDEPEPLTKYCKRPVVIEAIKYNGENKVEIQEFVGKYLDSTETGQLKIHTLEGTMLANIGDYIIRGINGEYYPCKPDIFKKTYYKVNEEVQK